MLFRVFDKPKRATWQAFLKIYMHEIMILYQCMKRRYLNWELKTHHSVNFTVPSFAEEMSITVYLPLIGKMLMLSLMHGSCTNVTSVHDGMCKYTFDAAPLAQTFKVHAMFYCPASTREHDVMQLSLVRQQWYINGLTHDCCNSCA